MSEAVANLGSIADPYSMPIDELNVFDPVLFQTEAHWGYFARSALEEPSEYQGSLQ